MPRMELAQEVLHDFDRFFDHQATQSIEDTPQRIEKLVQALQILAHSQLIGRKAKTDRRELVIGKESRANVALCRYVLDVDSVFVLAIRSQRESGDKRSR